MKNFKKLSKLQWKKNSLWIILLIIATLLINTLSFRHEIRYTYDSLTNSVADLEYVLGVKDEYKKAKPKKLDSEYIKYGNRLRDRAVKKYDIKKNEEISAMDSDKIDEYYSVDRKDIFYKAESAVATYDYSVEAILNENPDNSIFTPYTNFFMFAFIFILAMLMTSIESMSKYYDFTRLFPWSKKKDFLMKIVFGLIITALVYLIHIGIEDLIVTNSGLSEIYYMKGLFLYFIRDLILYLLVFIIFMGSGLASGNIIGHFGMNIVIFGFFRIIAYIISVIELMFKGLNADDTMIDRFEAFKKGQSPLIEHFLDPLKNMDGSLDMLMAYALIALIVLILGIFVAERLKTEKSGYMIVNEPIKILCLVLAVLTLTSLIFILVSSAFTDYNVLIGVALYLFFVFASYKFFKALFNVRIKV